MMKLRGDVPVAGLMLLSVAAVILSGCPIRRGQGPPPPGVAPGSTTAPPTAATPPIQDDPAPGAPGAMTSAPSPASPANPLRRAAAKAAEAACLSNVKQIALGMLMYAQDYDEHFPSPAKWHTGVVPYIRNEQVFHCPGDESPGTSYAFNRNLSVMPMTKIARPAETIMNFESTLHAHDAFDPKGDVGASLPRPPRHDDGNSIAFSDGHAKMLPGVPDRSYWVPQAMPASPRKPGQ